MTRTRNQIELFTRRLNAVEIGLGQFWSSGQVFLALDHPSHGQTAPYQPTSPVPRCRRSSGKGCGLSGGC